jgi:RNA polymerase sigma-70 factor (ECF subfamily)
MAAELALGNRRMPARLTVVSEDEDAVLVERFLAGDRDAFTLLVQKHQKSLYFFVLRQVRDADEAKDLLQRAFLKAFQGLAGFRRDAQFRTWLYRIAINLTHNYIRDRAKFRDYDLGDQVHPATPPPELITAREDWQRLQAAVARLPPKQRLTLELRVFEELSFREVAEILSTSEGAAKVNYHYAVKKLKQWLGGDEEKQA